MLCNRIILFAILVAFLGLVIHQYFFKVEYSPEVQVKQGRLRGFVHKSRLNKEFYKFLGIPYATAPLKELRFKPPTPLKSWEGTFDAFTYGSVCIQVDPITRRMSGSEDCLFLNIFVPKPCLLKPESQGGLPVLFYIHGGYFMTGSSTHMGPEYLLDENIILVTVNYRLNVFGFLNTEDGVVHGNMGLKDQLLALKWIHENIKAFGGDPSKITIGGQSAGSAAVHFHVLSPASRGLFRAAIMSSGTAIKPWSLAESPREQAMNLATHLKCPVFSSQEIVDCLMEKKAEEILDVIKHAIDDPIMDPVEIFAPSVESKVNNPSIFLPEHPYEILKAGKALKIPILTGVNSEEGLLATARVLKSEALRQKIESEWNNLFPKFFYYNDSLTNVTSEIRNFYLKDEETEKINFHQHFKALTDAFSDRLYIHSTKETVRIQTKYSPVYLYYFNYPLKKGLVYLYDTNPDWPLVIQFVFKEIFWFIREYILQQEYPSIGVIHGDDVALIFRFPIIKLPPSSVDFDISRQMVKMWTNFVMNPYECSFNGTSWPHQSPNAPFKYMLISKTKEHGSLVDEPFAERMKFWDRLRLPWKFPLR